jgi:hypothetical protein
MDQLAVGATRLFTQHLKSTVLADGVAFHQDALGAFGQRASSERAFEVLVFGKAAQNDVDRALPVLDRNAGLRRAPYVGTAAAVNDMGRFERYDARGLAARLGWHAVEQAVALVGGDGSADVEALRVVAA